MSLNEKESSECLKALNQKNDMSELNTPLPVEEIPIESSFTDSLSSCSEECSPLVESESESSEKQEGQQEPRESKHKRQFDSFLQEIEALADVEAKLHHTIQFMESSISQIGIPQFKSFWEARAICLQLFKENINPTARAHLWSKYNDLSKEARRLKEILDEQSAFAVEQIEIAVKALEEDLERLDENLSKVAAVNFGVTCRSMNEHSTQYHLLQKELNLLNAQASRINALRKELIRTEMRIRQKNKFFQRLSSAGDKVFPRRKELIKEISQLFMSDVEKFIQTNFSNQNLQDSLFFLREEIKGFQNIAKILTLNTHSFTQTRMKLSECWDQIKNLEKERKKERAQQKVLYRENIEKGLEKIQEFNQEYAQGTISLAQAPVKLDEIYHFIRSLSLGKEEFQILRDELNAARKPIREKQQEEELARQNQSQEKERLRRQKIQEIHQETENLIKNADAYDFEKLMNERDSLLEKINNVNLNKAEKLEIERLIKPIRDLISEKKESNLMALSDDDRQSLQQYKEVLKQRLERKQEIKNQIESLRKASGGSGLDFEQAMSYNAQMAAEKERLEKINHGIKEIQQKIAEFEKNR